VYHLSLSVVPILISVFFLCIFLLVSHSKPFGLCLCSFSKHAHTIVPIYLIILLNAFTYFTLYYGFSPWRPEFSARWLHVRFIVGEMALEHVFSQSFLFSLAYHHSVYPHSLRCAGVLTRQPIVTSTVFMLRASSLTWLLAGYRVREFSLLVVYSRCHWLWSTCSSARR
jgi:hypothetical protein